MPAKSKRTWPTITGGASIKWSAILISAFCSACGGGGSVDSGFSLSVDVVSSGETIVDWSPYPESSTYQVFRDGQPIVNAVGDVAYTDRGLLAGTQYCYVVRARGIRGAFDASSNEVCVTTPKFRGGQTGSLDTVKRSRIAAVHNERKEPGVVVAYQPRSRW